MKNYLKKLMFVIACFGLMLSGCEKESNEQVILDETPFSSRIVSLEEIPQISDYMKQNIYGYSFRSSTSEGEPIYDEKNIVENTDKQGNINYSISFIYDDTQRNIFYNLIINKLLSGELKTFVTKYTCDLASFDKFIGNNYNYRFFDGIGELEFVKKITETNRDGDEPCPDVTLPFGNSGELGSNSNNGSVVASSPNSNVMNLTLGLTSYSFTTYANSPSQSSGGGGGGSNSNQGNHATNWINWNLVPKFNRRTTSTNRRDGEDPCPDPVVPQGYVSVNISQIALNNLKAALALTPPQWRWFIQAVNEEKFEAFSFAYMSDPTKDTPATKAFFKESLNKMIAEPEVFKSITPFIIERKINDAELDPCTKEILNQLKNLQQNDIARIIARFDNPSNVYQLNLISQTPPINPLNAAETDWTRNLGGIALDNNYSISLNPTYESQATKMSIARTILHEILHAHILSFIDDINLSVPVNPNEFPIIYQAIINQTYNGNPNQLQHIQISRKYIIPLRDALQELNNSMNTLQYYEDLAWGALDQTSTFNVLFPVGSNDRERIIATNLSEDTNSTIVLGSQNITPLSNPCP